MSNKSFSDPNGRRHQFDADLEERPPFPLQSEEKTKDFNSDGNNSRIPPLMPYNPDSGASDNVRPEYSAFTPEVLGNVAKGICIYRNSIFVSVVMLVIYQGIFMIAQETSPNRAIDCVETLLTLVTLGLVLSIWPVWLAIQSSKLLYKTPSKIAPNVKKNNVKKNIVTSWVIWGAGVILSILNCLFLGVSGNAAFFVFQIIPILLCGVGTLYYLAVMSELARSVLKVTWGEGVFISYIVVGLCSIISLLGQMAPEASGNFVTALGAVGSIAAFYFLYCIDQLNKLFVPLLVRENFRWGCAIAIAFLMIFASLILIGGIISVMETQQEYTRQNQSMSGAGPNGSDSVRSAPQNQSMSGAGPNGSDSVTPTPQDIQVVLADKMELEKRLPDLASKETNALRELETYSTKWYNKQISDQEYTQWLNDGFLASCKEQKALLDSLSWEKPDSYYSFYQKLIDSRMTYGTLIMEGISQQSAEKLQKGLRQRIQTEEEVFRYFAAYKLPITAEAFPNINFCLFYAVGVGDIELAQKALDNGADINYTIDNYTPLLIAFEEGQLEMGVFLKNHGAKESTESVESAEPDKPAASTDEPQPDSKPDPGAAPEESDLKPANVEKESAEPSLDSKEPAD